MGNMFIKKSLENIFKEVDAKFLMIDKRTKVPVMYSPKILEMKDSTFALMTHIGVIFVDDYFNKLTDQSKNVIISHELGHWHYRKRHLSSNVERQLENEYEADAYAVMIHGEELVLKALAELIILIRTMFKSCNENTLVVNELTLRMINIREITLKKSS